MPLGHQTTEFVHRERPDLKYHRLARCVGRPVPLQARRPRLVDHDGEMVLKLPDNYEEITDPDGKARITDRVEMSIILWCCDNETKARNPELRRLFNLPQIEKRKQTVTFASEFSYGDVVPL